MAQFINTTLFTFVILLSLISSSLAETYTFIDSEGILHFTNVPSDIRYKPLEKPGSKQKVSPWCQSHHFNTIDAMILDMAEKYGLDPALIKALVKAESDFDPMAVSKDGAIGLMQLMPQTAKEMKVTNPFDPQENVEGGTKYFRHLWEAFEGDIVLSIAAYNAGKNAVLKYRQVPPYRQTRRFVDRVLSYYYLYKNR